MEESFESFRGNLLKWSKQNFRNYPWRKMISPYKVLIAEIMLQRTKADQVVPIYLSFLKKYPDPSRLSGAKLKDLKNMLHPLGLAWRAKKVYQMARYISTELNGIIPDDRNELLKIPGVGDYVADAILCFGFGKDQAVLDANVVRVLQRYYGMNSNTEARRDKKFREKIDRILPVGKAKEFNWAILDFAAIICTPKNPKHSECPIRHGCVYLLHKTANSHRIKYACH